MLKKNILFLVATLFLSTITVQGAMLSEESQKSFLTACAQANYKKIKTIFNFFAHDKAALTTLANSQDEHGNTPLLLILMKCRKELTSLVGNLYTKNGREPKSEDVAELTAFDHKRFKMCQLILDAHPNLNIQNNKQETALLYGIKNQAISLALAELFLNAGADSQIKNQHNVNALHYALHLLGFSYNSDKLLDLLFSKIESISAKDAVYAQYIISQLNNTMIPYLPPLKREKFLKQMSYFSGLISAKRSDAMLGF